MKEEQRFPDNYAERFLQAVEDSKKVKERLENGEYEQLVAEGKISGNWDTKYITLSIYTKPTEFQDSDTSTHTYYIPALNFTFRTHADRIFAVVQNWVATTANSWESIHFKPL